MGVQFICSGLVRAKHSLKVEVDWCHETFDDVEKSGGFYLMQNATSFEMCQ